MRNARMNESQSRIKIARRNINNLRYADDITLMVESEEELYSLLMKVKEDSENTGLKLNIKILTSWHSFHLFKNKPQFFVIHTVKGFSIVNEAK